MTKSSKSCTMVAKDREYNDAIFKVIAEKKKSCLLITLFAVVISYFSFFIPNCLADMTWQSIGPYGGIINSLAIDPADSQTLYAGTHGGGIFKSTNGGAAWTAANNGLTGTYVRSLAIDPTNSQAIYAGTNGGVFKSTNGGASWTAANNGMTDTYVYSLAIDPADSRTIYAGTWDGGIFKSTDGGAAWTAANSGLTRTIIPSLAIDPTNSQAIYAGTNGGVFKSTNGGASWTTANNGMTDTYVWSLAIDPADSQTIYAGTNDGIFKSTNSGAAWTAANSGLTRTAAFSLAIDPADSQTIYAGIYYGGIFKSTNGGTAWTEANSGLTSMNLQSLAIDPADSQTVYAGTYGGIFKSTSGGAAWTAANSGLTSTNIRSLAIDPADNRTIYAGTYGGGILKSTSGGAAWTAVNSELMYTEVSSLAIDPTNSQTIYAGTYYGGIFKSTNGGTAWTEANSGLTSMNLQSLAIDPADSQTVYAGTYGGIFKSTNGGTAWTAANSGLTSMDVKSLAIDPADNRTIYAGTYGGGILKSTNGGAAWTAANSGLTSTDVKSLAIDPTDSRTIYAGTWRGGIFKSTNGGTAWTAANSGLTSMSVFSLAIDPADSRTIYAGTSSGIFKSTNGGAAWTAANSGLTSTFVWSLAIDPTNSRTVYAGTEGGGVFKSISSNAPKITSPATATFTIGMTGTFTLTASGSPKPTFSMSGSLPTGVTFNAVTGILSGAPAAGTEGAYNLLFTATNGIPPDATRGVTFTVLKALPLNVAITAPANGSSQQPAALSSITGTATGAGLSRVEVQITDGIYYLQANNTFAATPAWLAASGTNTWTHSTGATPWVDGTTYTIFARASDGTNYTQPVSSTVKILAPSHKAYTQMSLDFTPAQLKGGDTTVASGKIMRLPDDGSSLAGLTVNLIVTPPSTIANPTPATIIIPMTTTATGSYSSGTLNQFATPGVYITQVRFDGNSTLAACSTVPEPLYVNIQSGYAIVITGKASNNDLLTQHTATTDTIIATLKKRGFLDANIKYLRSDLANAVTKQQIQDAITVWARNKIAAAPAPLYIIMIDHGTADGFVLGSARLTPDDLKGYLDTLETDPAVVASGVLNDFKRFIIIGACYSGAFIARLSKPGRVVITSSAPDEESLAGVNVFGINSGYLYGGEYFVDNLFSSLGRGDTFRDAFNKATGALSGRDPRFIPLGMHHGSYDILAQHPLLDDNGDAQASYLLTGTDGRQIASLYLGEGIKVNALSNPADIAAVSPAESLPPATSTKQLWLRANINSRVQRAWAEIRRPDTQTTGGGSGQVIPDFDIIPLIYDGTKWVGDYNQFDIAGTYTIYYYTKDIQTGEISPTVTSRVYKNKTANTAPTAFSLISPANEAAPAPMFPLTWQESTDPDDLTYTLLVAKDQSFTNIVYREENIPQAATYMPKDALKDPASATGDYYCQNGDSYCYWKVTAIDAYGATSTSNTRSFTIVSTNALPGIITGIVRDATTGAPIVGATVTAGSGQFTTLSNGSFFMMQPSGAYTVTATATGYQPKTLVNIALSSGAVYDASMSLKGDVSTLPGIIKGTVRDATTGAPIVGATVTAGSGQSTTLSNGSFLLMLQSGIYTVTATATGYQTKTLTNISITPGMTYDASMSLESNIPITYSVTPSAGSNGTISPTTAQTVNSGATAAFTITPVNGYQTVTPIGGTCPQGTLSGNSYTTGAITGDCTVNASFTRTSTTGDITGDGKADLVDAITALQVMSNITPPQTYTKEGDVDGDGRIGLPEAIYIMQKVGGAR